MLLECQFLVVVNVFDSLCSEALTAQFSQQFAQFLLFLGDVLQKTIQLSLSMTIVWLTLAKLSYFRSDRLLAFILLVVSLMEVLVKLLFFELDPDHIEALAHYSDGAGRTEESTVLEHSIGRLLRTCCTLCLNRHLTHWLQVVSLDDRTHRHHGHSLPVAHISNTRPFPERRWLIIEDNLGLGSWREGADRREHSHSQQPNR